MRISLITPRHQPDEITRPHRIVGLRSGFTLVELMVAITISAGLLLGGRLVFEQASTAERSILASNAQTETALVHTRFLHSVVRNLEIGTDSLTTFSGDDHSVQFISWCIDANLNRSRCGVHFTLDSLLTVITPTGPPMTVLHTAAGSYFRYLGDVQQGGQWYRTWGTSLTIPLAIGVIAGTDTTVLRIGDRG